MSEINIKEIAIVSKEIGIIETIIEDNGKTAFIVSKDGKVEYKNSITLPNGTTIVPLSADADVIKNKVLSLPPRPIEYESEQKLFNELKLFIGKYFSVNNRFQEISALYVMLTWIYERFDDLPYLRVVGTLGTGKSRFLKTLGACTYNSIQFGSSSVAAIFRTINQIRGTFILDEADFKNTEFSSDVAKILNNGNTKDMPIARMRERSGSKGEFSTDYFQVFGPKILASRESFSDSALESRCFAQRLYPSKKISTPISLDDTFQEEAKVLRGKLLKFRIKYYWLLKIKKLVSEKINNLRILQITQPLWNIALVINNRLARNVIEEAVLMDQNLISNQTDTQEADVLMAIMKLLKLEDKKIHIKKIATKHNQLLGVSEYGDTDNNAISSFDSKIYISYRKVGEIVGKGLHIRKFRDNEGIYILNDKNTREILKNLSNRYGLTDALTD